MHQIVYEWHMNTVDKLKQHLVESGTVCSKMFLTWPSTSGQSDWQCGCIQMDNILNIIVSARDLQKLWTIKI